MKLLDNFFRIFKRDAGLEKFRVIKIKVRNRMEFFRSNDWNDLDPKVGIYKEMIQGLDKEIRMGFSPEQDMAYLRNEEQGQVLQELKNEYLAGNISENEMKKILESKEYKDYLSSLAEAGE